MCINRQSFPPLFYHGASPMVFFFLLYLRLSRCTSCMTSPPRGSPQLLMTKSCRANESREEVKERKKKGEKGLQWFCKGVLSRPVASCDCRKLCRSEPLPSTREQKVIRLEDRQKNPTLASKQAPVVSSSSAHDACNMRRRNRSRLARPYIWRLSSLSLVICPSTCPVLQGSVRAARTAENSLSKP